MRRLAPLVTAITTIACASCGGEGGVSGGSGEWVRGRALSVRMTSTDMGGSVEVRNDSDRDAPVSSFMVTLGEALTPGESFTFALTAGDDVDEVLIEIGDGADREVFTLAMDGP